MTDVNTTVFEVLKKLHSSTLFWNSRATSGSRNLIDARRTRSCQSMVTWTESRGKSWRRCAPQIGHKPRPSTNPAPCSRLINCVLAEQASEHSIIGKVVVIWNCPRITTVHPHRMSTALVSAFYDVGEVLYQVGSVLFSVLPARAF